MCSIKSERGILILDDTTRLSRMSPTPCSKEKGIQVSAQCLPLAVFLPLTAKNAAASSWDAPVAAHPLMSFRFPTSYGGILAGRGWSGADQWVPGGEREARLRARVARWVAEKVRYLYLSQPCQANPVAGLSHAPGQRLAGAPRCRHG